MPSYVVKAAIADPRAKSFVFAAQKTMYGGKAIAPGDEVFVFASEHDGGAGLIARGIVTAATPTPKKRGLARQTPRVNITVICTARAKRAFGREQLKAWRGVSDGSPQAELDFKFYRQATNKIGGIGEEAGKFLGRFF
ncbi:MAG TPA: hypothetical protein VGM36_10860 [Rhizomicrobium sp.]|jgi:hypothetical protein